MCVMHSGKQLQFSSSGADPLQHWIHLQIQNYSGHKFLDYNKLAHTKIHKGARHALIGNFDHYLYELKMQH